MITTDLTHSQLRMWFMHTVNPRRTDLTIACAAELRAPMSIVELQDRLRSVVLAHPQLAAVLTERDGSPQWTDIGVRDALRGAVAPTQWAANADQVRSLYEEFVGRPWDLEHDVPWTVQLVDAADATVLFCRFHHIVCDGDRSLTLFLNGLGGYDATEPVPDLTELLTEPPDRPEAWADAIADLTDSLTSMGNPRERVVESATGVHRWTATLDPRPGERDEAALLERLGAAMTSLVGEQLLVAIPFDGCTNVQQQRIGYFGNPGIAVLSPGASDGWGEREYARAETLATVPFQVVMADDGFRNAVNQANPFDILLVPRTLFGYESPLVRSAFEPVASTTPYALVLNHWRDAEDRLRISLESAVFGPDALAYLGARILGSVASAESATRRGADDGIDVVDRLRAAVNEHPDAPAIETPSGDSVSYQQLWAHAAELAELLDAGHRGTVAIVGEKHPNEIVAVVATHLVGGTVLRLDRDQAATRRALASLDNVVAVIQLDQSHEVDLPAAEQHTFAGPFGPCQLSMITPAPAAVQTGPAPTLYVTLTSGSTGEPKPIPFSRADFNSLIAWHLRTFPGPRRMLQFSKLSFDVAYHVIYATLCGGGTLVFGTREIREDPKELLDYIEAARIEKVYLPTVLLRPLAEFAMAGGAPVSASSLREIIVAGGSLELTDEIRRWFAHTSARLFNHYGMSETQDVASYLLAGHPETWPARPPAGPPIDGVDIRVVGGTGEELPAGLSGTVVVRTSTGETVTGDVGYRDRDGLLHILGRADRVIKQRGYRVNLQALEAHVARAPGIADAVAVTYVPAPGSTAIAVLATAQRPGETLDLADIKEKTRRTLGDGYDFELHVVPDIPRLPNAKPDLLELARIAERLAAESVRPSDTRPASGGSAVLLAVRQLMPNTAADERSRFLDVGLDSIRLMSLAALLRQDHPGLSIADFFRHPTIGELQRALDRPNRTDPRPARRTAAAESTPVSPEVAVVGLAGRFPGASTVDEFWANQLNGTSAVTPAGPSEGSFVPVHGNLSDVDSFDHAFFGITPAEARRMDPQIRVFLEQCWAALENAGEAGDLAGKNVGVFAGGGLSTYLINEVEPRRARTAHTPFLEYNTLPERLGNDRNYLTSTVSYRLGLTGPSIVVQAACATSLTAVHLARQSLLSGECDIAIAGGVSIIYPQPDGYEYVDGSVRSQRGECRPFDQHADGTVFGNGAGVVVLKRSSDAKADENTVYAEIIGSATNHDGSVKGSFSAPNPSAQTRVIDAALPRTGPAALNFVEAHGTGTAIGDAIEWNALLASGINAHTASPPCVVGSVKGSVGHLDEAAGVAGFIKACLAIRHRIYPGTHGFTELHPALADSDRFTVSGKNTELPDAGTIFGAVSSFGMGGANCHVVLRSPDPSDPVNRAVSLAEHPDAVFLPVSARTTDALGALSDRLTEEIGRQARWLPAASLVRTLGSGRRHFEESRGVLYRASNTAGLTSVPELGGDRPTELVWAFPGQGSGFTWSTVAELCRWPAFAAKFGELLAEFEDRLGADTFAEHVGRRVDYVDHPFVEAAGGACVERCTIREQVLRFSFQLALANLLGSFGIEPDVVTGHSLGEITAAVWAGRISEPAALTLVAERSRLMELATPNGFMAQLGCDATRAGRLAAALDLDIAALNGPHQTVVAGDPAREDELRVVTAAEDIAMVRLPVGKAFHSRMMADAADQLAQLGVEWGSAPSAIEFVSANPGYAGEIGPADLNYWTSQLTSPVDYLSASRAVLSRPGRAFLLELGFGATLGNLVRAAASAASEPPPVLINGMKKSVPQYIARATAAAYQAGQDLDWAEINQLPGGELIPLPSYPFARTEISLARDAAPLRPEAGFELCPNEEDWILEHQVDGRCVVPAAGILVLFARAAGRPEVTLADISFERPIEFSSPSDRLESRVSVGSGAQQEITLWTRTPGSTQGWVRNASAVITEDGPEPIDANDIAAGLARRVTAEQLYQRFEAQRLAYGPNYRNLNDIIGDTESASATWTPSRSASRSRIGIPAGQVAGVDGVLQAADVLGDTESAVIRMPAYIARARLRLVDDPSPVQRVHVRAESGSTVSGLLRDDRVGEVAELAGIRFQAVAEPAPVAHRLHWRPQIAVGASLPEAVAAEIEQVSEELSGLDGSDEEVVRYQQELGLLETHALRILDTAGGSGYVQSLAGSTDRVAERRRRAFDGFLTRADSAEASQLPESVGDTVQTEWSVLRGAASALPRYFDGSLDGESILFSGDGAAHLREYYQSSFLLNRLNGALRRIVDAVAAANSQRVVKILEVGGGTGASTEGILDALRERGASVDYTFTDLSEGLIRLAEDRFGEHPGFHATLVDLDSDESVAALDDDYDIVVAVDVIHATRDIARTVDRLRGQLAPNGMMLLVEDLKQLAWVDLTFGLLDSWWSFDDDRTDHPLLDAQRWHSLLSSRFDHVEVLRACGGLALEDTVADEGLFVCANPTRQRSDVDDGTLVLRFDAGPVLDPDEAERFADALLHALRQAEERPGVENIVFCTTDAMLADGAPRVLTAGSMAAALVRVAAAEDRRVKAYSLALDTEPGTEANLDLQVKTLLTHGHPYVNGAIVDGRLHLPQVVAEDAPAVSELEHDAVVVFGGESDLGQAAVEWFTAKGVRRVYLVGRAEPRESTRDFTARLGEQGVEARYLTADVTDAAAVRTVAKTVAAEASHPLVLNLAAVLRDGTIDGVSTAELASVLGPKVRGSHNIDSAFRDTAGSIVLFSSTSALLGNAGQAAHAMACAYLDGLAEWRTSGGPRTTSVQWGPWEDVGITARQGMNDRLRRMGENPSPARVFLPELGRAAAGPGGTAIAADLSSPAIRRRPSLTAILPPLRPGTVQTRQVTREPLPETDIAGGDVICWAVANVLGVSAGELAADRSLADNGVDSLNLIEVRSLIERRTGVRVPLNSLSDAQSLDAIRHAVAPVDTVDTQTVFYVAGIFGRLDAAPDLEEAAGGAARLVTLSSPTRGPEEPGRLDILEVARDLADQIEREQASGAVTVAGHSFGAMLAYSTGVELRRRGRELRRLIVIDGDPIGAPTAAAGTEAEFASLLGLSTGDGRELNAESRAAAFDSYQANCEIARSRQDIGDLGCPIAVVVPEKHVGVGLTESTVVDPRWATREALGGESIEIARVPGDHFTMLRSPNAQHLIKHIIVDA
jgi:acyl transferase domain-containing protein/acyl-coenzyme A synthetase/AMP-(fatty) acid ligase/aryl carrier-like protein/NAD(P)-dependent dehydrogenase (short-subunit alcohol dehydrogenase family)/surfactin synthase thioesterase subunit